MESPCIEITHDSGTFRMENLPISWASENWPYGGLLKVLLYRCLVILYTFVYFIYNELMIDKGGG